MRLPANIGIILLAIFLILYGLNALVGIGGLGILVGLIALLAGIVLLLGREFTWGR